MSYRTLGLAASLLSLAGATAGIVTLMGICAGPSSRKPSSQPVYCLVHSNLRIGMRLK